MKKNMGTTDRATRFLLAAVFAALYFSGIIKGIPGIILLIFGGILVLTSLLGFCPLYTLFGWNTCRVNNKPLH